MIDDPVVLIRCEAAARGRQLRLARVQAAQNAARSDGNVSEALPSDQVVGMTLTPQGGDNAVGEFDMNHAEAEPICREASRRNAT
jgi:hypothetical protein